MKNGFETLRREVQHALGFIGVVLALSGSRSGGDRQETSVPWFPSTKLNREQGVLHVFESPSEVLALIYSSHNSSKISESDVS
jgi:hypothetical protein